MTSHPSPVTTFSHIGCALMRSPVNINQVAKLVFAAVVSGGLFSSALSAQVLAQACQTSPSTTLPTETETSPAANPTQPGTAQSGTAQSSVIAPPADPTPKPTPFTPAIAGVLDLSTQADEDIIGVGHLRPQVTDTPAIDITDAEAAEEKDGDAVSWLEDIILPLYISPGGEHWGWLYQGWLVPDGQTYLAIGRDAGFAMVKSEENLYTFPVLDIRDDGWFQVQYTTGGSAWAHTSQLSLGETTMFLENWEETLSEQAAVYFLNESEAQPLRSQPEAAKNMLGLVSADSLIEPLDFAGDWMRVRVTRPAANCTPLTGATVTEGWMRWRNEESQSLVWYQPDGTCQAG